MVNFSQKQQKIDVVFTLAPPILITKRSRVAQTNDDEGEKGTTGREKRERGENSRTGPILFLVR